MYDFYIFFISQSIVIPLSRPFEDWDDCGSPDYCFESGRKRGRLGRIESRS